jgi:Effector Associated Constant Component 1
VQAVIAVTGAGADLESLSDWLMREPELRGRVRLRSATASPGFMGGDTAVQVVAAVAGASTVWAALARSLSVWLTQRRGEVSITVTGPGGRAVSICAKRISNPREIIRDNEELIYDVLAGGISVEPPAGRAG